MATAKKTDAPAKKAAVKKAATKKTATKKTAGEVSTVQAAAPETAKRVPAHHEIAELAVKYWAERGHRDGNAEQDWLRAERTLRGV